MADYHWFHSSNATVKVSVSQSRHHPHNNTSSTMLTINEYNDASQDHHHYQTTRSAMYHTPQQHHQSVSSWNTSAIHTKRQRDDSSSAAVVVNFVSSQEDNSSCCGMDMEEPSDVEDGLFSPTNRVHKRQRMGGECVGLPHFLSKHSPTATATTTITTTTFKPTQQQRPKPTVVAWWKKPRPPQQDCSTTNHSNTRHACRSCFVCQRTFSKQGDSKHHATVAAACQPFLGPAAVTAAVPVNQSLLAYFSLQSSSSSKANSTTTTATVTAATAPTTTTTARGPSQALSEQQDAFTTTGTTCTFCDRAACAECRGQCQDCLQMYCSLCLTVEYSSSHRLDRTVCLDCSAANNNRNSSDTDEMHVD
jgi:hypothetical protein